MNRTHGILLGLLAAQVALAAATWMGGGRIDDSYAGREAAFDIAAADVRELRIVGEPKVDGTDPDSVQLRRTDVGWVVASADDYPADPTKVDSVVEKLAGLEIGRAIAVQTANHQALGVGPRNYARRVTLVTGDAEHEVILGSGARQISHVRLDDGNEVYTTKDVGVWNVRADARNYIDPAYVQVDRESLVSVSIRNADGTLSFTKGEDGWRLAELPPGVEQDAAAIGSMINALTRVSLSRPVGREVKPEYGFDGATEVTLGWVDEEEISGSARLLIGTAADENSYYAKSDDSDHVVAIAKWTAEQATAKKRSDFVKKPAEAASPQ